MKILVPIKRVPDPYVRIRLTPEGRLDVSTLKWVASPVDEVALEEAVRIRERGAIVEIVAVSVGSVACEETLRAALARGADRALLILDDGPTDPGVVAHLLAAVARREQPDLILLGREAPDDNCGETGPRLAALLAVPQVTFATQLTLTADGAEARVTRETDSERETLTVSLPAVITVNLHLNQPRLLPLPAIIKARAKPLEHIPAQELGPRPAARVTVVNLEPPPPRARGRMVADVDALITALREEARVI